MAECLTFEGATIRATDGYVKIAKIVFMRNSSNAWFRVIHESLGLLRGIRMRRGWQYQVSTTIRQDRGALISHTLMIRYMLTEALISTI